MREFFGKYRGKVENNIDPQQQGRVQVSVPAVLGEGRLSWAMPCVPYAGPGVGLFAVPPVGANVWVEFEGGDPDYPILGGCFWGLGEAPAAPALPFIKVLKTDCLMLKLDDTPAAGGLTLEVGAPAVAVPITLTMTSSGIEVVCGAATVTMSATEIGLVNGAAKLNLSPISVSVNDGALEVI